MPASVAPASQHNQQQVNEVVLLRDHCISVGRPMAMVVEPIVNSILDTIFWADGYKSLAHVVFITFGWWKGLVGLRFMMLLLYVHVIGAVVVNARRSVRRTDSEERRAALYAYRASTAYLAQLVERFPYLFFVLPQGQRSDKRKLHGTVAVFTLVMLMMWFPMETRTVLNTVIYYATMVLGLGSGVEDAFPAISVYDVLDLACAPVAVLTIVVGGLGQVGPKDPRYDSSSSSSLSYVSSSAAASASRGSFPNSSSAPSTTSSSNARGAGVTPNSAASSLSTPPPLNLGAAAASAATTDSLAMSNASSPNARGGIATAASASPPYHGRTSSNNSANNNTNTNSKDVDRFLTPERLEQYLCDDFSFNQSQTRQDIMAPLLKSLTNDGALSLPYWMQDTPEGDWDREISRSPALPIHAHKILALIVKGPNWSAWKRVYNKPERKPLPGHGDGRNPIADAENAADDVVVLNHPTGFSQVKCGYNRIRVRGVKFDDVVSWFSDDMFKENGESVKAAKDLNVFKYDVLLSEYRRLAYHTYTVNTPEGPISSVTKVIHFIYKQMVLGVAARDCPMFTTARELTEGEMRHYGLFEDNANTFYPHRVVPKDSGKPQPLGRVFLISSSPASNVPPAPGHVKATIHRHAILVVCPPKKTECGDADDDEHDIVDIITMMCGEPGGKIPSFAVEIGRGEQLKVVMAMQTNIIADMKEAGLCTYPYK